MKNLNLLNATNINQMMMPYNKNQLFRQVPCPHCKLKKNLTYIQQSPYVLPVKKQPYNQLDSRVNIERDCCCRAKHFSQKLRLATEGNSPRRKQMKSKTKLQPLHIDHKPSHLKEWQKNGTQQSKKQKLRQFLQHHNELIKEWSTKEIAEKQDFITKIRQISLRKGKSFSLKKKRNHSKSYKDLSIEKQRKHQKNTKEIIQTARNQINSSKRSEKGLKRLKTIQTQMYKEHLLNLIDINDKNDKQKQKMKNKIMEHIKEVQEERIRQEKKKLRIIEKRYQDMLKRKAEQQYYQQLSYYQNSEISLSSSLKLKKTKQQTTKRVNWADNVQSQLPLQSNKISQNVNPELEKNKNKLTLDDPAKVEAEPTLATGKSDQSFTKNAKLNNNIVSIQERKQISKLSNQKTAQKVLQ